MIVTWVDVDLECNDYNKHIENPKVLKNVDQNNILKVRNPIKGILSDGVTEIWFKNVDGQVKYAEFRKDGKLKHEAYLTDLKATTKDGCFNYKPHKVDGPAEITYHPNGKVNDVRWYLNGKQHRTCGPADVKYRNDGIQINCETWYLDGKEYNPNGPSTTKFYPTGEMQYEQHRMNDEFHNTRGPAVISYTRSGNITEEWYLKGKKIFPKRWLRKNQMSHPLTENQQTEMILMFG